jgi:hypothetical protein
MADYTIKNIPDDLYQKLQSASEAGFRSLNQEILFRVKRSFDAEDARTTALHARWIHEALASGDAKPLKMTQLDAAFKRGAARARTRKQKVAA